MVFASCQCQCQMSDVRCQMSDVTVTVRIFLDFGYMYTTKVPGTRRVLPKVILDGRVLKIRIH